MSGKQRKRKGHGKKKSRRKSAPKKPPQEKAEETPEEKPKQPRELGSGDAAWTRTDAQSSHKFFTFSGQLSDVGEGAQKPFAEQEDSTDTEGFGAQDSFTVKEVDGAPELQIPADYRFEPELHETRRRS